MRRLPGRLAALALVVLTLDGTPSRAEVVRVDVKQRQSVLNGKEFGSAGPYEKLSGTLHFEFDPANPLNRRIVDLQLAPRNPQGRVEASADFMVLRPTRAERRSTVALIEVSNRGGKAALSYFNRAARGVDPSSEAQFGDGLLLRLGMTVIWVGWQYDVPQQAGRLRLHVPWADQSPKPLEGLVRSDWTVDRPAQVLHLAHRNHVIYPALDPDHPDNVLTVRDGRLSQRRIVDRSLWSFANLVEGSPAEDRTRIHMPSGFQAGKIYELVYRAQNPRIVGLGLAAIRDVASYVKYDPDSLFPSHRAVAFGVSQTGRFLRHFLYQGFNTDERWRQALDGMLVHTAGAGRGSFNHRFGQPSRDAHRYSAFFYPTDIFPFSGEVQTDPMTGVSDGLLAHMHEPEHIPKIFYTNTGYEYWGRAAALLHVSPDGKSDAALHPRERIFHLAGGQHFVGRPSERFRLDSPVPAYRGNPLDFLLTLRAILVQMVEWVDQGRQPASSAYPRIANGSLAPFKSIRFPSIPRIEPPAIIHEAYRMDYGPRWSEGIIDQQPPRRGAAFPSLVAQLDEFGNELGGVKGVELRVPAATYAPWHIRSGMAGGNGELTDFQGTFIPFAADESLREERKDPRPSLERLYGSKEAYLERAWQAALQLVRERFLLEEDVDKAVARAAEKWDFAHR